MYESMVMYWIQIIELPIVFGILEDDKGNVEDRWRLLAEVSAKQSGNYKGTHIIDIIE